MAKDKKYSNDDLTLLTSTMRCSYPHLHVPVEVQKGSGKKNYSIELMSSKKETDLKAFQRIINRACVNLWGDDKEEWPTPLMLPFRDGDKPHGKKKEVKEEHKGMWVFKASSSGEYEAPYAVGLDPNIPLTQKELYPGCYVRAQIKAHAYDFAGKTGVKFILNGVQFVKGGKALGGKKPASQMFGTLESQDDDESDLGEESFDESED